MAQTVSQPAVYANGIIWNKGTWYFVFTERICLLCPNMEPPFTLESPKQNIILCKSGASVVGHDQSGLCMALKTVVNLFVLCMFNKSRCLLGSSFIHFLIHEWNDSYDIMLRRTGVSWRYKQFETNRFNRKNLHVPPRTVGITADYVQYIIPTGLCRVCWLLVWVIEWAMVTMLQAARYGFRTPGETCDFSLRWNVQTGCGTKGMGILPWG